MPQLLKSKELRAQRASLVEENRKVLDRISATEDQARRKELEAEWDKRDAEIEVLTAEIERAEKQERYERDLEQPVHERRSGRMAPASAPASEEERAAAAAEYRRAFWRSLSAQPWDVSPRDREILARGYTRIEGGPVIDLGERRDGMSTTNAAGGYTVPQGFFAELQRNMLAFGGVRPFARILTTDSGNTLPIPTVDDTSNEAAIVSEGAALTSPQDPTFGQISLGAFMYRTLCLVSLELLQDSAFDLEAFVRDIVAERVARGTNRHFTTGNGSTQPDGFITNASSGYTAATSSAIAYNDLIELEHSIDPAYRAQGTCTWQMHDSTLKLIKQLVDSQSRPLWLPGLAVREPDTILGYRYGINQHMAEAEASAKTIAFGNFQKFIIRDVRAMMIVRANELHIGNGQVGFYVFSRHDSDTLDAGTDPIKYLTHPSP
jgi:HK97 family phage major capsid protein